MEYIKFDTKEIIHTPYTIVYSGMTTTHEEQEIEQEDGSFETEIIEVQVQKDDLSVVVEEFHLNGQSDAMLKEYGIYPVHEVVYSTKLYDATGFDYIMDASGDFVFKTAITVYKNIDVIKEYIISIASEDFNMNVDSLVGIDVEESSSWYIQEQEANAYVLDNTVITPLIDKMLVTRSKYTKAELVQKILDKATMYKNAYGEILGTLQDRKDKVQACVTVDEILALELGFIY